MKDELDKALCEKYPKIFADRNKSMQETCMCWGFSCGDGWYPLIDALCSHIQGHIDNNPHLNVHQVVASQVKEKFGTLRFYVSGGNEYIDGMIDFAETISGMTCDVCGNPGKLESRGGWWSTRCADHVKVRDL